MRLNLKVIPKSSANQIVGAFQGELLKIRLKAQSEKGKANQELISFLAQEFALNKQEIKIVQGKTQSHKVIEISFSPAVFQAKLQAILK